MNNKIQIIEENEKDGFTGNLKIIGAEDEREAKFALEMWSDNNNSLCTIMTFLGVANYYIATVISDDYE